MNGNLSARIVDTFSGGYPWIRETTNEKKAET